MRYTFKKSHTPTLIIQLICNYYINKNKIPGKIFKLSQKNKSLSTNEDIIHVYTTSYRIYCIDINNKLYINNPPSWLDGNKSDSKAEPFR